MANSNLNEEITISTVTSPDDFSILTTIEEQAFSAAQLVHLLFPPTPATRARTIARHQKSFADDATATYIKASTPSGEIVGFGKWYFYLTPEAIADSEKPFPFGEEEEGHVNIPMAKHFFWGLQEKKIKVFGGRKHVGMAILAVKPEWQRRGVGMRILRWGLDRCDREDLGAWIDATPEGKALYEKCGWKEVDHLDMDLGKWGGEEGVVSRIVCMVRDPAKEA